MQINEINRLLSELFDWYNSYDFNNVSEEEKKQLITSKFVELGIFNIDFGDMDYFNNKLSPKASYMAYNLKKILVELITVDEKINQLLNNPNIIKFAASIGKLSLHSPNDAINDLLDVCTNQNISSDMGVKNLVVLRDILKYADKRDNYYNISKFAVDKLVEEVELKKNETQQADQLIREIIDLSLLQINYEEDSIEEDSIEEDLSEEDSSLLLFSSMKELLKNVSNDDLKIEFILNLLKIPYSCYDYCTFIAIINSFDKKLELCRKIADYSNAINYSETISIGYLLEHMLEFIFKETFEVKTQEDAQYLISKFQEVMADKKLKSHIDLYVLNSILTKIKNDSVFISTYDEIIKNPSLFREINDVVSLKFMMLDIKDDRLKLQLISHILNNRILSIKDVESILEYIYTTIGDKSLFLDKSLMEALYKNPEFSLSIFELASPIPIIVAPEYFKADEVKYIQKGMIDELLERYKTLGFIDDATLNEIYNIASKYIKNLTMEDLIKRISSNPNAKELFQHIAIRCEREYTGRYGGMKTSQKYQLEKFASIFPRTRFGSLPDFDSYQQMPIDMCEKFNVKTWNQLIQNPLFNQGNNTKRALVEIIAISGLFENDSNVELRKRQIISLFENYSLPLSKEDIDFLGITDSEWITSHFEPATIKTYKLRAGITIPQNLSNWLSGNLTMEQMSRIKKETGNIGSELTKYLSPYVRIENGWKLRNGIQIDLYSGYLKPEMTNEEYMHLLTSSETPREIINFLNPYEEVREQGYRLKQSLTETDRAEVIHLLLDSHLNNRYNFENLHRMFDGLYLSYNPDFYQFFLENQDQILATPENQAQLKEAQRKYDLFKKYYASRGNYNPNYNDMLVYLNEAPYTITFGNEEFAQDAKNTKVSDDGYTFYEGLLQETRKRHLTTVPRHEKTYEYVAPDGSKYQVIAKVLRADDPFNLLVGETKFTNCCQRYDNVGEACMKHASTSQNGGIFATYLIINGVPTMLTQSWFWTNEAKACLDNVEATSLITGASGYKRQLLQDIATFAIKSSCIDMIKSSKDTVDAYITERTNKIMNSSLSEEEKQVELRQLEIVRQRQTIKIITVGDGCDDLRVKESFRQIEPKERSYGPKGYKGYRDSTGDSCSKQHVIIQTNEEVLTPNDEYVDIPMFRDDRRISVEAADDIRYETLRKITDIESVTNKTQMTQYIKDGKYTIKEPELLAQLYGCYLDNLRVITGEDWYCVYSDGYSEIEVYDLAKKDPRLQDEGMSQTVEMVQAFEKILTDSIVLDNSGSITEIKPIKADLREDTSYLLYLEQIKRGVIEQIGDDVAYSYTDVSKKTTITKEQQQQILANYREIRDNQNPNMIMHGVLFRPTAKEIEKLLARKIEESKNIGRAK
jgi:hypothetical protein